MKKLMIVAAVAAMTVGAFADCQAPTSTTQTETYCGRVWDVKVCLKSTVGKVSKTKVAATCTDDAYTETVCYQVVGTRKYQGVLAACDCTCGGFEAALAGDQMFWNITTKSPSDLIVSVDFCKLIGKNDTTVEVAGKLGDNLTFAGFGTFDAKNENVKSVSGYVAGTDYAPVCTIDECNTDTSIDFDLCSDEGGDAEKAAAYGTFTLKYNASASKKLTKLNTEAFLLAYVPAYAWADGD